GFGARLQWRRLCVGLAFEEKATLQRLKVQKVACSCWRESVAISKDLVDSFRRKHLCFSAAVFQAWRCAGGSRECKVQSNHEVIRMVMA
ncbi:unnamed protein product, partial [Symbiodinium pilosum]